MKNIFGTLFLSGLILLNSCKEDSIGQFPTSDTAPSPVKNVVVESLPGGAKITYDLPKETDISYIKGEFYSQGKQRVVHASIYDNVMKVEGLGSTEAVEITLYTVDHSENRSTPVVISFHPLTPPVQTIFESISLRADFGGVNALWENETGLEVGITLLATDEKGVLEEYETLYTLMRDGDYTFRGFDTKERIFAVTLTDRWGNSTDTIRYTLSPYYETILDRTKHKRLGLPLDNTSDYSSSMDFSKMFDNNTGTIWHTDERTQTSLPLYFTVDLGVEAKLSRFKLWHRSGYYYGHHNIKEFEVWGATDYKTGQYQEYWGNEWESDWFLLGDYVTPKASGLDNTTVTNEDKELAAAGFEFIVPLEAPAVRYLRFKMKSNWSGGTHLHMAELTFWGNDGQEE